jgi:hypothetical protein
MWSLVGLLPSHHGGPSGSSGTRSSASTTFKAASKETGDPDW